MLFLYGFSFILMLHYMLCYTLPISWLFLMSICIYLYTEFVLKSKKRVMFAGVFWIISSVSVCYYVIDFLQGYYDAIVLPKTYIHGLHVIVIMIIFSTCIYHFFYIIYRVRKRPFGVVAVISGILMISGHVAKRFNAANSKPYLLFHLVALLAFYLSHLYIKNLQKNNDKMKGYRVRFMAIIAAFIIVYSATYVHDVMSANALIFFYSENVEGTGEYTNDREKIVPVENVPYVHNTVTSTSISDSFNFQNKEIMRIHTDQVEYLKGNVFEIYRDGNWISAKEIYQLLLLGEEDMASIQNLTIDFDEETAKKYFQIEEVKIELENIKTEQLFLNSYGGILINNSYYYGEYYDSNTGICRTDTTFKNGDSYEFLAILPKYKEGILKELIDEKNTGVLDKEKFISELSTIDPSIQQKAKEIIGDEISTFEQVIKIQNYLRSNYTYDVSPLVDENGRERVQLDDDKVVDFLNNNPYGFCQHYASSMVLMLQSIGIPARYVTGFKVTMTDDSDEEEYELANRYGGVKRILDANAHAWVEVYFQGVGWLVFEPTAGQAAPVYNKEQREYNEHEKNVPTPAPVPVVEERTIRLKLIIVIIATILGVILLFSLLKMHNRRKSTHENIEMYYKLILNACTIMKIEKEPWETPREHALKVDSKYKQILPKGLLTLISVYEKMTYGNQNIASESLFDYEKYLKNLIIASKKEGNPIKLIFLKIKIFFKTL